MLRKRNYLDPRTVNQMRFPKKVNKIKDFDNFVRNHLSDSFAPPAPFLERDTTFLTFGSCFAENVAKFLDKLGYNSIFSPMSERLFTSFALRDFFAGLHTGDIPEELVYDFEGRDEAIATVKENLTKGATVIITLGLSMCWYHKETGKMAYDPVNAVTSDDPNIKQYPRRLKGLLEEFEMRQTTIEKNYENIVDTIKSIRAFSEDTTIVITVSPVPLQWCQSDQPILAGDFLSKATLRFAAEKLIQNPIDNVWYFPSFEIIRWAAPHTGYGLWGTDGEPRHIDDEFIKFIVNMFGEKFLKRGV
ncbi:MAG: GSCFA domain-containing protein [Rhodospirillales bacterium]|nr:GSCFA domain-containing protein [Rhodospirillales bacterium]